MRLWFIAPLGALGALGADVDGGIIKFGYLMQQPVLGLMGDVVSRDETGVRVRIVVPAARTGHPARQDGESG